MDENVFDKIVIVFHAVVIAVAVMFLLGYCVFFCVNFESIEKEIAPVKIVDAVHKDRVTRYGVDDYYAVVRYNGEQFKVDGHLNYFFAEDKIGNVVMGRIQKIKFKNGSEQIRVIGFVKVS